MFVLNALNSQCFSFHFLVFSFFWHYVLITRDLFPPELQKNFLFLRRDCLLMVSVSMCEEKIENIYKCIILILLKKSQNYLGTCEVTNLEAQSKLVHVFLFLFFYNWYFSAVGHC